MGFGSMFGSLGRAISRPFKDIHKAVKKVGGGVHAVGRGMTGGGFRKKKSTDSGMMGSESKNETGEFKGQGGFSRIANQLKKKKNQMQPDVNQGPLTKFISKMKERPSEVTMNRTKRDPQYGRINKSKMESRTQRSNY